MYDRILVPTDGAEGFENVAEHALELAEKFNSDVHVISVVDTGVETYDVDASQLFERLHRLGEKKTHEIADRAEERDLAVFEEVPHGRPHEEILDYADEMHVDLIVMGTHGRTGLGRIVMGSVAEKVIRQSDIPVMTVELGEVEE